MGVLKVLGLGVTVIAILGAVFMQYAKLEMQKFTIDFSQSAGKIVVITGANSGLGYYTALALAKEKARVVMACRNLNKCEEAKSSIVAASPNAAVECMKLDLASFQSIRSFAEEFISKHDHLDVLVNNAGIMALPQREVTSDGLEFQIGTNHFGHFLLTALLYPHLSQNGRIINHSSGAHMMAATNFVFKDLLQEKLYDPWVAYGNSKLANLLFTYELDRRLNAVGNPKNIKTIAVHPGKTLYLFSNFDFFLFLHSCVFCVFFVRLHSNQLAELSFPLLGGN
jgi:NAD(P)-dependent dehydrogenase (short-subunit alcohol dehydrogenase family)